MPARTRRRSKESMPWVRWTAGFAAYQRRRSSLTSWICSGSVVPLRPKFVTPKKCIGSNERHDSLVDAMKNVDHHVFPTQPRSFHPHRHLLPLLTQFMRPRLVRPDCCAVGCLLCTTSLESLCRPWKASTCCCSRCFDFEHLAPTLRQHLPLLSLRSHRSIFAKATPSITSMLHKNIFQMVSHVLRLFRR